MMRNQRRVARAMWPVVMRGRKRRGHNPAKNHIVAHFRGACPSFFCAPLPIPFGRRGRRGAGARQLGQLLGQLGPQGQLERPPLLFPTGGPRARKLRAKVTKVTKVTGESYESYESYGRKLQKLRAKVAKVTKVTGESYESYESYGRKLRKLRKLWAKVAKVTAFSPAGKGRGAPRPWPFQKKKKRGLPPRWSTPYPAVIHLSFLHPR
jgi:hypothetical protein